MTGFTKKREGVEFVRVTGEPLIGLTRIEGEAISGGTRLELSTNDGSVHRVNKLAQFLFVVAHLQSSR